MPAAVEVKGSGVGLSKGAVAAAGHIKQAAALLGQYPQGQR